MTESNLQTHPRRVGQSYENPHPISSLVSILREGKCKNDPHGRTSRSSEELEKETPVISFDYMGPKSRDDKSEKIDSLPIIVGIDCIHTWRIGHKVPKKGHDPHAIKMIAREIHISGYSKMILKSDQEPAIRELLDAVKREREPNQST